MKRSEITEIINEVLGNDLVRRGYGESHFRSADGKYEWHFEKNNKDIRLTEAGEGRMRVTFLLFNTTVQLQRELCSFIPEADLQDRALGFEFTDGQTLRDLLLRFKPIIMDQGIPWMTENYEKYKRLFAQKT